MSDANVDVKAILKNADFVPTGMKMTESNPLENAPALSVGKDIVEGQTIAGYYEGSKTVEGKKGPSHLHYLRLAKTNDKIALWGKASLNLFFSKRAVGEFVRITYNGLGTNEDGNDQHFFEFEVGTTAQ